MSAIVVGYMTVYTSQCGHTTSEPHYCIHDWRVFWGNVDRLAE